MRIKIIRIIMNAYLFSTFTDTIQKCSFKNINNWEKVQNDII